MNNVLAVTFITAWHTTLPLIPVYAASLGAAPLIVGLIVSSNVALPLLLAIHVGAAADRFGTARIARWSAILFVVSYLLVVTSPSLGLLALGLAGVGLADLGLVVAVQTYVATSSAPENRDRNFAYLTIWISLGALVGPVLGGFLADHWGFRAAFAGSMTFAALTLLITRTLPEVQRTRADPVAPSSGTMQTLRQAATLLNDPGVSFVLLTNAALMFATSVRQSFFPLYLRDVGFSTTLIGVIFSLNSLCQMAIRPMIAPAVREFRHAGVLAVALCLAIVGLAITPRLTSFWALAAAFSLVGVGNGFMQPLTMSLVSGRAAAGMRGLAIGLRMTGNQFAQVIGPPCFGLIVGAFGLGAAFQVGAIIAAIGLAPIIRLSRALATPLGIDRTITRRKDDQHAGAHSESSEGVLGRPGG
ncbi:MAG TPA: MFS transporter [bacterium]|nr:MFS transporter [bacterium]